MKYLFLTLVALLVLKCSPPVVFEEAYPIGEKDLVQLPEAYKGVYICESDSTIVLIKDSMIIARSEHFFRLPLKSVEEREDCSLDGDEMFVSGRDECIPLVYLNDSTVQGTVVDYDTLFIMNKEGVARLYQGHVVLSQKLEEREWAISLLSLQESGDLWYRAITDKTQIKKVKKITAMTDITKEGDKKSRYRIRPSEKQFDALINDENIFIECETLLRMRMEDSFMYLY